MNGMQAMQASSSAKGSDHHPGIEIARAASSAAWADEQSGIPINTDRPIFRSMRFLEIIVEVYFSGNRNAFRNYS